MAALLKGVLPDHYYGGPLAGQVWGELQEAGTWFVAWYCCPRAMTHSVCVCVQQNLERECITQQEI